MTAAAKTTARERVRELVQQFRRNEFDYLAAAYNETQARTDFITPLLAAFGWDVKNTSGHSLSLREVIEEATVEVGEERLSKRPDYELRVARQRKLFVEAKKPHVRIDRDRSSAFQTRRYGYSASLPVSVLTNFYQLAVYDCVPIPADTDQAHVARLKLFGYEEFETRFDELWEVLAREEIFSGAFDERFAVGATRHGSQQFDDLFLGQVREWRALLANDINSNTPGLSSEELTYVVQLFLSRIVFLRICEDRELEKYETLRGLLAGDSFEELTTMLQRADAFYNSGLFRLLDDERLGVRISDAVLQTIVDALYYPKSPYTFAVVETQVLGEIYEQFLGEQIVVSRGRVEIILRPEVRESGGVVPTPQFIVDAIVDRTLGPLVRGRSPKQLKGFTVADICCGSGIFLLSSYDYLLNHHLSWYLNNDRERWAGRTIFEVTGGQWRLSFDERRRILTEHVFGVDIDANAVEVARFSLLLKLIEEETESDLKEFVRRTRSAALPALDNNIKSGNSLVSEREWHATDLGLPRELISAVLPFDWQAEFPGIMKTGGFSSVVGNPPYIRIQNMTAYSPEEVEFYKQPESPYETARQDNFDKYALFIERSLQLLADEGRIGVIVPHKFMTIQAGRALRRRLTTAPIVSEIVHFGVQQVFGPRAANYTCLLMLDHAGVDEVVLEQVASLDEWRYGSPGERHAIPAERLGSEAWGFANDETQALFDRIRAAHSDRLGDVAEIFVGVQTSADDVYIFRSVAEDAATVSLEWNKRIWRIERDIVLPCLMDVSLSAFTRPDANSWMIFPYHLVNGARGTKAELIPPAEMKKKYPLCWDYLKARQDRLENRNIVGGTAATRQWYQFGRSQSLTKFDSPKIILPILSIEPRYTYDDSNIVVTGGGNGPYYMVRPREGASVSVFYLLALLNHPMSEAFVRMNTSPFRGGYYSHGKQFIEALPVPLPTHAQAGEIETLVTAALEAADSVSSARTVATKAREMRRHDQLKRRIEEKMSEIFGLRVDDVAIAREVPIPS